MSTDNTDIPQTLRGGLGRGIPVLYSPEADTFFCGEADCRKVNEADCIRLECIQDDRRDCGYVIEPAIDPTMASQPRADAEKYVVALRLLPTFASRVESWRQENDAHILRLLLAGSPDRHISGDVNSYRTAIGGNWDSCRTKICGDWNSYRTSVEGGWDSSHTNIDRNWYSHHAIVYGSWDARETRVEGMRLASYTLIRESSWEDHTKIGGNHHTDETHIGGNWDSSRTRIGGDWNSRRTHIDGDWIIGYTRLKKQPGLTALLAALPEDLTFAEWSLWCAEHPEAVRDAVE